MKYILTNVPSFIINYDYEYKYLKEPESSMNEVQLVGGNSGNCMFWESTKKIIENQTSHKLLHWREFNKNKDKFKDKIESVAFVLANNINPSSCSQLGVFYHVIKDLNCKKYLFSIGAQNESLDLVDFNEKELNIYNKFFPLFEYVYLRGKYTYDLLKHNNIPSNNVKQVGCPSILLKPIYTDNIKGKFKKLVNKHEDEIKVGINFPQKNQHEKLYESFKSIMSNKDVYTLAVDGVGWYNFINHGKPSGEEVNDKFLKNRENFIFSNNVFNAMNFFKNKTDFMFGTRIHGTILGLCAGIPSMCIAIDSRTYELCEQMNIPYINCVDEPIVFSNKNEIIEIFKNNFDVSKLDLLKKTIDTNKKLYRI